MLGTFNNDQPIVEIEICGVRGNGKQFSALVDSGFNGYLQMPFMEAFPLGLILAGAGVGTLADGSPSSHFVCEGMVRIDDRWTETAINISPANIVLLGTKLLKKLDKTFILNCAIGRVEILENATR